MHVKKGIFSSSFLQKSKGVCVWKSVCAGLRIRDFERSGWREACFDFFCRIVLKKTKIKIVVLPTYFRALSTWLLWLRWNLQQTQ